MSSEPSAVPNDPSATYKDVAGSVEPGQWVDRYGNDFYRFALRRLRDASEAEEAVQETFLSAIAAQHQFTGSGSQRGWLLAILRRKIIDSMRQRAKRNKLTPDEGAHEATLSLFNDEGNWRSGAFSAAAPTDVLESSELWQLVRECLKQLVPIQADVFVLSVMDEMAPERISDELGISMSNVWTRLHRARLNLAKCVRSKWFPHELDGASP